MSQVVKMVMIPKGSAAANQIPQPGLGVMYWIVMMFCGDEIGDARPPIQLARAIPRIRHGPTVELGGSVRRIGFT